MVALNDAAWFSFLVGWVGLTQQMLCVAAVTIRDRRAKPLVPRWFTIASIVGALLVPMANGCAFTMTGTFAWDGLLGFYVPIFIWGIWLDGHAFFMRREIRTRMDVEQPAAVSPPAGPTVRYRSGVGAAAGQALNICGPARPSAPRKGASRCRRRASSAAANTCVTLRRRCPG